MLEVFTTRLDTIYGVTFVTIAPEHPMIDSLTTAQYKDQVEQYKTQAKAKTDLQRAALEKEKS